MAYKSLYNDFKTISILVVLLIAITFGFKLGLLEGEARFGPRVAEAELKACGECSTMWIYNRFRGERMEALQ